jgi:hypothetical protein
VGAAVQRANWFIHQGSHSWFSFKKAASDRLSSEPCAEAVADHSHPSVRFADIHKFVLEKLTLKNE